MKFKYREESEDGLSSQQWDFYCRDAYEGIRVFDLVGYVIMKRETKRHDFKIVEIWDSYEQRNQLRNTIEFKDVPLEDDTIKKIRQELMDSVVFAKTKKG